MLSRIGLISLFFYMVMLTGCQPPPTPTGPMVRGEKLISVYDMADKLGLTLQQIKTTDIVLKNSSNTVMIFPYQGGQVFVNGKPAARVDSIEKIGNSVYLPESLINKIRSYIISGYVKPVLPAIGGLVVIDAGHGGKDPGATSVTGYYEKNVNLNIAQKVASSLKSRGVSVVMTRSSDNFVELENRAGIANQYNAKLLVSIHADSNNDHSKQGCTVYIAKSASSDSKTAAQAILQALSNVGMRNNGIRRADYKVLVLTRCPAVLVETGYLSNSYEASMLNRDSYQDKIADAISQGICNALEKI